MDIDITPAAVRRSAQAVMDAGDELFSAPEPPAPSDDGFQFSQALARWQRDQHEALRDHARGTRGIGERLDASADLIVRADQDAADMAEQLRRLFR